MNRALSDPNFLPTVARWFAEQPELLVLFCYSRAAGSKDFYLLRSFADFQAELAPLPPQTSIVVFRLPQLPLRGVVNADFVEAACARIPDGAEYLLLLAAREPYLNKSRHFAGETHQELREHLADEMGETVAVGLYPDWLDESDDVISAIVPSADGTVGGGVY